MVELADSADGITQELETMKLRGYTASTHQRCEECGDMVFCRPFYLFPCSHGFHEDCLMKKVTPFLDSSQINIIQSLKEKINVLNLRVKDGDKRAMAQLECAQDDFDGCIAGDCPLCGYLMIKALSVPLVFGNSNDEAKTWEL